MPGHSLLLSQSKGSCQRISVRRQHWHASPCSHPGWACSQCICKGYHQRPSPSALACTVLLCSAQWREPCGRQQPSQGCRNHIGSHGNQQCALQTPTLTSARQQLFVQMKHAAGLVHTLDSIKASLGVSHSFHCNHRTAVQAPNRTKAGIDALRINFPCSS